MKINDADVAELVDARDLKSSGSIEEPQQSCKTAETEPDKTGSDPGHLQNISNSAYPPIPCGWTYFIERSDGLIKIGFSAKPSSRIANHRRQFGTIKILAVVPQSVAGEFETHQRFAGLRVEGEWFRCSSNLLAFIRRVRKAGAKIAPSTARLAQQSPEHAKLDRMSLVLHRFRAPLRRDDQRYWVASNIIEQIVSYQDADDDAHRECLRGLMARQIEHLNELKAA